MNYSINNILEFENLISVEDFENLKEVSNKIEFIDGKLVRTKLLESLIWRWANDIHLNSIQCGGCSWCAVSRWRRRKTETVIEIYYILRIITYCSTIRMSQHPFKRSSFLTTVAFLANYSNFFPFCKTHQSWQFSAIPDSSRRRKTAGRSSSAHSDRRWKLTPIPMAPSSNAKPYNTINNNCNLPVTFISAMLKWSNN